MAKTLRAFKWAGTVSAGTRNGQELLATFYGVLLDLAPETIDHDITERERRAYNALSGGYDKDSEYSAADVGREIDEAALFLHWLVERLNKLAPEGYYFGTLEGAGDEYGFWPVAEEPPSLAALLEPYVRAYRVCVQGNCPITGVPLDARTAVLVEDAAGRVVTVMSRRGWEQRREDLLALLPGAKVADGLGLL